MTPDQAQQLERFHRTYRPVPDWCLEAIAECPRAFGYQPPSRGELRALHLDWILYGTPGLIFPPGVASAPLSAELLEIGLAYARVHDGDKKRLLAIRARRIWVRLVEMAVGIRVEFSAGIIGESVFRDDA